MLTWHAPGTGAVGGVQLPNAYVSWAEALFIQLAHPNASLLGHAAGILAGLAHCARPPRVAARAAAALRRGAAMLAFGLGFGNGGGGGGSGGGARTYGSGRSGVREPDAAARPQPQARPQQPPQQPQRAAPPPAGVSAEEMRQRRLAHLAAEERAQRR
jgi:hypothetical protein